MIVALWVAVAVLFVATLTLFLIVAGLVRGLDEARQAALARLAPAQPGMTAPSFRARTLDGEVFDSESMRGQEHLILFAHPGCRPCDDLVAEMASTVRAGQLPPMVLVSQAESDGSLGRWEAILPGESGSFRVVLEERASVSMDFGVEVRPYGFAIDPAGRIGAGAIANTVDDLLALAQFNGTPESVQPEREVRREWASGA